MTSGTTEVKGAATTAGRYSSAKKAKRWPGLRPGRPDQNRRPPDVVRRTTDLPVHSQKIGRIHHHARQECRYTPQTPARYSTANRVWQEWDSFRNRRPPETDRGEWASSSPTCPSILSGQNHHPGHDAQDAAQNLEADVLLQKKQRKNRRKKRRGIHQGRALWPPQDEQPPSNYTSGLNMDQRCRRR